MIYTKLEPDDNVTALNESAISTLLSYSNGGENFLFEDITHKPDKTSNHSNQEAVGCPYYYDWCMYTPVIYLWQFLLGTFFVAVGYPTCSVMSYAIYSKILGPKPQVSGFYYTLLYYCPCGSELFKIILSWCFCF